MSARIVTAPFSRIRSGLATVTLAASLALSAAVPMSEAEAATPAQIWSGVSKVGVQCLASPGTARGIRELQSAICERVRDLAARGAPVPVSVIQMGDPAVLAAETVTLLVHASVQPAGRNRLVAISVRPFRVSTEQTAVLFGAAPRAALIPSTGTVAPALDAALRATLAETAPWLAKPTPPQAMN